jgi:hypothetical protein
MGAAPARPRLAAALLALVVAGPVAPLEAAWDAREASRAGAPVREAFVANDAGQELRVYRDAAGRIHGLLALGPGLLRLGGCPTLQVDDAPPAALGQSATPCTAEGPGADFTLGRIEAGRLRSGLVLQLMRGREAVLRYPLRGAGYGEARFPLTRSLQALQQALGAGVEVVPR